MPSVDLIDVKGKKSGSVDLPEALFDVQTNVPLIHQVVVAQLAAARQGTQSTLRRGEVSGSGKKPFKQKGTGRARQGSVRMPQHRGGGIIHGPKPRDYSQRTPKKMVTCNSLNDVISSLKFLFPILVSDLIVVDFGVPHVPVDSIIIFLARLLNAIYHL